MKVYKFLTYKFGVAFTLTRYDFEMDDRLVILSQNSIEALSNSAPEVEIKETVNFLRMVTDWKPAICFLMIAEKELVKDDKNTG